jgi:hypothetical protein
VNLDGEQWRFAQDQGASGDRGACYRTQSFRLDRYDSEEFQVAAAFCEGLSHR